jgi:hypothetical protein
LAIHHPGQVTTTHRLVTAGDGTAKKTPDKKIAPAKKALTPAKKSKTNPK